MNNPSTAYVEITLLGDAFCRDKMIKHLPKTFEVKRIKDVLHLDTHHGDAFIFDYGVLITWGVNAATRQQLKQSLRQCITGDVFEPDVEEFRYHFADEETIRIENDVFYVGKDNLDLLLAASHAFAQSAKLETFEGRLLKDIQKNTSLAGDLSLTGKIKLSRKQLAMRQGELFATKNDIVLKFNLLDTPEYFWSKPEFQAVYEKIASYLELTPRINLLNLKLGTVSELLTMLADEQNHKHSAFLEWIIIILIAIEIPLFFFGSMGH